MIRRLSVECVISVVFGACCVLFVVVVCYCRLSCFRRFLGQAKCVCYEAEICAHRQVTLLIMREHGSAEF